MNLATTGSNMVYLDSHVLYSWNTYYFGSSSCIYESA